MDRVLMQHLRPRLMQFADRCRGVSPLASALASGLAENAPQPLINLFGRYCQILSTTYFDPHRLLAGLHSLALQGEANELAIHFPTCGGEFDPDRASTLVTATADTIANHREDLLDAMMGCDPQQPHVARSAGLLLGSSAVRERFGGGIALVELGGTGFLHLRFDRYAYDLGIAAVGDSPVQIACGVTGRSQTAAKLAALGLPPIVGRHGLSEDLVDLRSPADRLWLAASCWPDQVCALQLFRAAADLPAEDGMQVRQGLIVHDWLPLLVDAYNQMEAGNTLLLYHTDLWMRLQDDQQKAVAMGVQRLAAQVQPHKPIAWVQIEPSLTVSKKLEIRLHTFGWADPEDRAVRILGLADPLFTSIEWLE
jgi:hypothetical protein